jgi:hypothetical protein
VQKLIVALIVIASAITLWTLRHQSDEKNPVIEGERLQEAQSLTLLGSHVAERVQKIETCAAPPKSTPTFKIAGQTPKTDTNSVKVEVIGSRTEKGNLVITGEAWAVGDKGQKLFGGQFERVEALEAIVAQPRHRSWAVGPTASFGAEGWMFGASVASPSVKVLMWEPRLLGTIITNGRRAQASMSVLFEL